MTVELPDVDAQISVLATLMIAVVFSERFTATKKIGALRWLISAPPAAAVLLSIWALWMWGTGEAGSTVLDIVLYLAWWAMLFAFITIAAVWMGSKPKKIKGDPFADPRRPKPPPEQ